MCRWCVPSVHTFSKLKKRSVPSFDLGTFSSGVVSSCDPPAPSVSRLTLINAEGLTFLRNPVLVAHNSQGPPKAFQFLLLQFGFKRTFGVYAVDTRATVQMIRYIYMEEGGTHGSKVHRVTRVTMKTTTCYLAGCWRSSVFRKIFLFKAGGGPHPPCYSFTHLRLLEEVSLGHRNTRWQTPNSACFQPCSKVSVFGANSTRLSRARYLLKKGKVSLLLFPPMKPALSLCKVLLHPRETG